MNPADLLGKDEPLDPELARHLEDGALGPMIRHPLVFSVPHMTAMNAVVNAQLAAKKELVAAAMRRLDFRTVCWLHERPYRFAAFRDLHRAGLIAGRLYWSLLGELWVDTESAHQQPLLGLKMFRAKEPGRGALLTPDEAAARHALPAEVPVFRGGKHRLGISWTISETKARWFARRWLPAGERPLYYAGFAKKTDILALFLRRNEDEVIIDPAKVYDWAEREVV